MTKQELIDFCLAFPGTYEDYPFEGQTAHSDDGTWTVMRHATNKKTFAHIYNRNGKLCINLKCDPLKADFLRGVYADLVPGWHMNKTHWNTVYVGGDVPEEEICGLISHSYDLVKPKRRKNGAVKTTIDKNYLEKTSGLMNQKNRKDASFGHPCPYSRCM